MQRFEDDILLKVEEAMDRIRRREWLVSIDVCHIWKNGIFIFQIGALYIIRKLSQTYVYNHHYNKPSFATNKFHRLNYGSYFSFTSDLKMSEGNKNIRKMVVPKF